MSSNSYILLRIYEISYFSFSQTIQCINQITAKKANSRDVRGQSAVLRFCRSPNVLQLRITYFYHSAAVIAGGKYRQASFLMNEEVNGCQISLERI